ncbi:MAG: SDR family oxidoreductase [Flavobacteriaceae bacterium]|nr:SDR family oxidoreductase [Flavobacteriaceae bacterium]
MDKLKNKVAIITGGAGGIGFATAKAFLDEGAKVLLVGRSEKKLEEAVKKLKSSNVSYCTADVSKTEDTLHYVNDTLGKFGKIDIFLNNAGIEGAVKPIAEYPEAEFDKVIAINLRGVWLGCKYVIPKMSDGGSVMITSSVAGLKGFAGLSAYVASKHGVIGIMKVAALEHAGRNIRVNSIHPGPVHTRMMYSIEKEFSPEDPSKARDGFESNIPFSRYADASEVADLAVFLASDESKYMTGTQQVIDGGMMIQ